MSQQPNGRSATLSIRSLPPDRRVTSGGYARAIGAFLPKATTNAFQKYGFHNAEILTSWQTIVGKELAAIARPEHIRWPKGDRHAAPANAKSRLGATLTIGCDPAFALEVSYQARSIIDRINQYFGYGAIAELRVAQRIPAAGPAERTDNPDAGARNHAPGAAGDLSQVLAALGENVARATRGRRGPATK